MSLPLPSRDRSHQANDPLLDEFDDVPIQDASSSVDGRLSIEYMSLTEITSNCQEIEGGSKSQPRRRKPSEHVNLLQDELETICDVCRSTKTPRACKAEQHRNRFTLFSKFNPPVVTIGRANKQIAGRLRKSRYYGWRMWVLLGCFMSGTVLCCNIGLVVLGACRPGGYSNGGISTLIYGDETAVSRWNTVLHVFINVLSSILLAGSNYTMQVVSSPTRDEVDRAHMKGDWLEIGILSLRNMKRISRKRALLWFALASSSVPLHLFYNASIFKITAANEYEIYAIDRVSLSEYSRVAQNTSYSNLTNAHWKQTYGQQYVSGYSDLYLVVDQLAFKVPGENLTVQPTRYFPWKAALPNSNPENRSDRNVITFGNWTRLVSATDWIPYELRSTREIREDGGPTSLHVVYAFAYQTAPIDTQSRIQISLHFMVVVIAFNSFKLCIMACVLVTDQSKYLVTLGDAISSFLQSPDPTTEGCCMLRRTQLISQQNHKYGSSTYHRLGGVYNGGLHPRRRQTTRSYAAGARADKGLLAALSGLFLLLTIAIFAFFVETDDVNAWSWGAASQAALSLGNDEDTASAMRYNAWLANTPQVLLSFCYLNLNTLCTAMGCAAEWNSLGPSSDRKALRVTEPRGRQRSTYFLQLAYKYAVPLIIGSTALHWTLSQTFFLIRIDYFDSTGENRLSDKSRSACGCSLLSLIVFFFLFFGICGIIQYMAHRKMLTELPPAKSCSLMIRAACHPANNDIDCHLKAVQWGVVGREVVQGFDHCSISSNPIAVPEEGKTYY